MEEKKSFVYTIILGFCLILCLILIGKMMLTKSVPEHTPFSMYGLQYSMENEGSGIYTEEILNQWIQKQLPEDFPLTDFALHIRLPNRLVLEGEIEQAQLKKYMQNNGIKANTGLNAALLAAPDRFSFAANISVDLDAESRLPIFTVESVRLGKIQVSNSAFTQVLMEPVQQAIYRMICEKAIEYENILWKDGSFELKK